MPDARRAKCKGPCGRTRKEVTLSWTGYCADCGQDANRANFDGLTQKRGPAWQRWRRAMAACVGGVLPEDLVDDLTMSK
jgi:hypothetical protein